MRVLLASLVALLFAPLASAQGTLHDLEAINPPDVKQPDWSFPFTIAPGDVGKAHGIAFRGTATRSQLVKLSVEVCDADGKEAWWLNGTRALLTFAPIAPAGAATSRDSYGCESYAPQDSSLNKTLSPGDYTLIRHGPGQFQLMDKFLERGGNLSVNGTIHGGTADAWAFVPTQRYFVDFTGDVSIDQYDFSDQAGHAWKSPATLTAEQGVPNVFTITGADGAPYSIALRAAGGAVASKTPGPGVPALVGVLALAAAALAARRRR